MAAGRGRAVDLFCGIGGTSLGLKAAGYSVSFAADLDKEKVACYNKNQGHTATVSDVNSLQFNSVLNGDNAKPIEILAASPPCQGFSLRGKRDSGDPRNFLWQPVVRLAAEIRPVNVLIENVPAMRNSGGKDIAKEILSALTDLDYGGKIFDLNAKDFGVPQDRRRTFVIGSKKIDIDELSFIPKDRVSVWDAIQDIPQSLRVDTKTNGALSLPYVRKAASSYARKLRGQKRLVNHCEIPVHSSDWKQRISKLKWGEYDERSWQRRLHPYEPSSTITAGTRSRTACRPIHPFKDRVLSVREAARICGFPDSFQFSSVTSEAWMGLGNAVPPPMTEEIFKAIAGVKNALKK